MARRRTSIWIIMNIILASASPRRHELLKMIVEDFTIAPSCDVDEVYPETLPKEEVPVFLSQLKAKAYLPDLSSADDVLITADTVVILDNKILGKPHSREEAMGMLSEMQGKTHKVVTGVTLTTQAGSTSFSQLTEVEFDTLTKDEIIYYVDKFHPYDKAGAYGIQEWIGAAAIIGIKGSFYNVMGLPIHALYKELKKMKEMQ